MCKGTRLLFDPHYSRKNVREPGFLCPFMQVSPHLVYAERWSLEPKNGKSSLLVFGGDQTMSWAFFIIFLIFTCFRQTERGNRRRISILGRFDTFLAFIRTCRHKSKFLFEAFLLGYKITKLNGIFVVLKGNL